MLPKKEKLAVIYKIITTAHFAAKYSSNSVIECAKPAIIPKSLNFGKASFSDVKKSVTNLLHRL